MICLHSVPPWLLASEIDIDHQQHDYQITFFVASVSKPRYIHKSIEQFMWDIHATTSIHSMARSVSILFCHSLIFSILCDMDENTQRPQVVPDKPEVRDAIFSSNSRKAPGSDDLPFKVWQELCPIVKGCVTHLYQSVNSRSSPPELETCQDCRQTKTWKTKLYHP